MMKLGITLRRDYVLHCHRCDVEIELTTRALYLPDPGWYHKHYLQLLMPLLVDNVYYSYI